MKTLPLLVALVGACSHGAPSAVEASISTPEPTRVLLTAPTVLPLVELGSLIVTDSRPPLLRMLDPKVHGSIGLDVLRMVTVAIDGAGQRLILSPPTAPGAHHV